LEDRIDNQYIRIRKDGDFLYGIFADNLHVTIDIAKACVETRLALSEGRSYPQLIDVTGIKSITKEAREYLATEGTKLVKAGAFIVGSPLNKMLGNIFLFINTPEVPTKLFTDEGKAKEWLKKYQ
jgi:hypothetical protein